MTHKKNPDYQYAKTPATGDYIGDKFVEMKANQFDKFQSLKKSSIYEFYIQQQQQQRS